MGSWKGRQNQYILLVKVLYCKLPTNSKHLPAFPLEVGPGTKPRPQRWNCNVVSGLNIHDIAVLYVFAYNQLKVKFKGYNLNHE